jgi:hypothetical protein
MTESNNQVSTTNNIEKTERSTEVSPESVKENTPITIRELRTRLVHGKMTFQFNGHVLTDNSCLEDYCKQAENMLIQQIDKTLEVKEFDLNRKKHQLQKNQDEYRNLYKKDIDRYRKELDQWPDTCKLANGTVIASLLYFNKKFPSIFHCEKCNEDMTWILLDENTIGLSVPPSQQLLGITDPTCKFALPIQLDINNPGCPREVIDNEIADIIRDLYSSKGIKLNPLLQKFIDKYPAGRGDQWQKSVYQELIDKPINLIEDWLDHGLPRGLWRSYTRIYLNERKETNK